MGRAIARDFDSTDRRGLYTGILADGRKQGRAYLGNKILSASNAIIAKCYDCTGQYSDGKVDCEIHVCTLYPWMPYADKKLVKKAKKAKKSG